MKRLPELAPALLGLALASLLSWQAEAKPVFLTPRVGLISNHGFCAEVPEQFPWTGGKPAGLQAWTSYCGPASPSQATALTESFPAPKHLSLYLLGFNSREGISMSLRNLSDGSQLLIDPDETPRGGWLPVDFSVPRSWWGKPIQIAVIGAGSGSASWLGFSEPLDTGPTGGAEETALLLLRILEYFVLLSIPFFAACSAAVRGKIGDLSVLVFIGLATNAAAGYLAFWLWFFSPKIGHLYSFLLPLAGLAYLLWIWRRLRMNDRRLLAMLAVPWLLTFAAATFTLAAGFLYGGLANPLVTSGTRFSHELPMDNSLPFLLAEDVRHGHVPKPMVLDWLSSDRPPLQTGLTLLQYPFVVAPRSLGYQVIAVLLQSLWIPALWAFLQAFDISQRAIVCALGAVLFSGFAIVNSFFVWPKLLAAAYALAFSAFLLSGRLLQSLRKNPRLAALAGALLAFGLLAHGGSAFAMLGLVVTLAVLKRCVYWKSLVILISSCILLYLPWMMYQKFYDPPGNRLLNMHLAGVDRPNAGPFAEVLWRAYSKSAWDQILKTRASNARTILDTQSTYWSTLRQFAGELPHDTTHEVKSGGALGKMLRSLQFFCFLPSLGLLMFGPLFLLAGLARRLRTVSWRTAALSWLYVVCTLILWCALLFAPHAAVVHQGTYVTSLLATSGSVLAIWAVSRRLAIAIVTVQSAFNFLLYVVYSKGVPSPGTLGEGIVHYGELFLLIASLLLIYVLLKRLADKAGPEAAGTLLEPAYSETCEDHPLPSSSGS